MIDRDLEENTTVWLCHADTVEPKPYKTYLKSFSYLTKEEAIKAFIAREEEIIRRSMDSIARSHKNIIGVKNAN
jgi:hypothetical protein